MTLIRREIVVEAPLRAAWDHLAQVERWTTWAKHIRRVDLRPPGSLTSTSMGRFVLSNGIRSEFRMVEYNPPASWKWVGPFLWLEIHYDHAFAEVDAGRTRLTWTVEAEGFGATVFGHLFALIYNRNLDRAIPALVAEMEQAAPR